MFLSFHSPPFNHHVRPPLSHSLTSLLTTAHRSDPDGTTAKSASTSSFVTALVLNVAIFAIEIFAFTILRPRFKAVYEPRTLSPIPSCVSHSLIHTNTKC